MEHVEKPTEERKDIIQQFKNAIEIRDQKEEDYAVVSRSGRREGGREGVGTRARRCRGGSASSDPPSSLSRADATEHVVAYNNVILIATSW